MKKLVKIGVVLLVAGICLAALGRAFGGSFSFAVNPKTHEFVDGREEGNYYVEDNSTLDAFTSLDIDIGVADIDIREGDSYHLDYIMYREDKPTVSTKGDKLVIKSKEEQAYHIGFDFRFFEFEWKTEKKQPRLTITVPKGSKLSDVTIFTESGDCELGNIVADRISIKSEYGDITLTDTDCSTMDMTLDSGDAEIKASSFTSYKLWSEYGDVTFTDVGCSEMDMTLESGDVRIKDCSFASWALLSEYGDIEAKKLTVDKLDAKTEDGDVEISIKGKKENYGFHLSCDDGDIRLDGRKQGDQLVFGEEKEQLIKVKNEYGDVEINFE